LPTGEVATEVRNGVTAILLAAGSGSRFGGGKLLAPYRGLPLIEAALASLEDASVDERIVVVGDDAEMLREVCERHGARIVENPDWRRGQSTSVLTGLRACDAKTRAAVVLLGDQPLVGARAVERLVAALAEGARVAVATYGGKWRNPVLFSRGVWPLLEAELAGDEGARPVLRRHPELVVEVPCEGVGDPTDVDTREDLRRLEEMRGIVGGYKMAEGRKSRPKNVR
jgi:CTP:molybdopterin cytidylyltransferase MocA